MLRKGYPWKLRYNAENKISQIPIDFTGRRVVVQFRAKRSSTVALMTISTDTSQVLAGNGFIEMNLTIDDVNLIDWVSAIAEIAVEWSPNLPEWQFSFPVGVEFGLIGTIPL